MIGYTLYFRTTKTNLTQLTQLMIIPRKWKLFSSNVKYKTTFSSKTGIDFDIVVIFFGGSDLLDIQEFNSTSCCPVPI